MYSNKEIANLLKQGGRLLELYGENAFKVRAYQKAARVIEGLEEPLGNTDPASIQKIDGIGKNIADKISAILSHGSYDELDRLLEKTPEGILELLTIKGIGPQKVRIAWDSLDITSPADFLEAAKSGKLLQLKGFAEKTVKNITEILEYYFSHQDLHLYCDAEADAEKLLNCLKRLEAVQRVVFTGDLRRKAEVLTKIELLVLTEFPDKVTGDIASFEECIAENGIYKTTRHQIPVEIHYCRKEDEWGTQLLQTTGNKRHLELAGLNGSKAATEEDIYKEAGIPFIIPEMREGRDEMERIQKINTAEIITVKDLKGVIHAHTTYSDGHHSLEEMVKFCREAGYSYIGISDHSRSAFYADGLEEETVRKQWAEIDRLNGDLTDFRVLKGIESDILRDGSLDYPDALLKGFDFVIASVHSVLNMREEESTARIIKAVENPYTSMLGHPTGRLLLSRKGYPLDHKKVLDACAANNVSVEINANPLRLDLDWRWVGYAADLGIMISINPDAHKKEGIFDMQFGVNVARKAGLERKQVLNACGVDEVLGCFGI